MTQLINLSQRLKKVASYLPKSAYFADIGSDHAYLPCYVCLHDNSSKAIAGEINEGPYHSALKTVTSYQLNEAIDVRLGNGLQVLKNEEEIKQIVIAGMGGSLIKTILEDGKAKIINVERIIVQPNVDARNVRKWLIDHQFIISNEEIVEENDHIYEIIVADKIDNKPLIVEEVNEKQLLFGPVLLANKTTIFYKKWQSESEKLKRVIEEMKKATVKDEQKIKQFEIELKWIEEEIGRES